MELQQLIDLKGDLELVDTNVNPVKTPILDLDYDERETPVIVVCLRA